MMDERKGRSRQAITIDRRDQIVGLIGRWTAAWGRLSGPALESRVESCLTLKLTRQGMFKHPEIVTAFQEKQKELSGKKPKRIRPLTEELLRQRITNQAIEIDTLKTTLETYEERFVRHLYNARQKGLNPEDLERPLPSTEEG